MKLLHDCHPHRTLAVGCKSLHLHVCSVANPSIVFADEPTSGGALGGQGGRRCEVGGRGGKVRGLEAEFVLHPL